MSNKPNSPESKDTKAAAEAFDGSSTTKELHSEVPPENYPHKSFEYAVIKWSVNNFSYNNKRKFSLRSSTFDLHAAVPTSWCLGITWPKNDALEVHLIRMGANPVQKIKVSGRVGYINAGDHQLRWQCQFSVINTETGLCFSNVTDILRHTFCSFKIVFQFFIFKDFELKPFEYSLNTAQAMNILKPKNQGETSIPITVLSKDGYAYTIDRRICDKSSLTQKITNSENNIVSLLFDAEVTFQCLAYLYLKRIDYIVDVRTACSLDLAANLLGMKELKKYISPSEIDIFSKAGGEGWKILNEVPKDKLEANKYYQLHCTPEVSWWLELKETEKDIKAIVSIHKCDRELDLNFKISVLNSEEKELISIEKSLFANTGVASLIQKTLINKDSRGVYRNYYLPDNLLAVQWNLCHSDIRFKNEITKISRSSTQTASGLADPMAGLSISDDDNIVIIAGDKKFRVHKEILKSRSESFMDLLSGKNECEVTVPGMPGDLMELILKFTYSGQLYTSDWETIHRLYLKLSEFKVYFLPLICEQFFLHNLNPDNWQELLKLAIKSKNLTFVKNIVKCICDRKTISQSEEWKAKKSKRKFRKKVSKLFKNSGLSISFSS